MAKNTMEWLKQPIEIVSERLSGITLTAREATELLDAIHKLKATVMAHSWSLQPMVPGPSLKANTGTLGGCQHAVPPHWDTGLQMTTETCHAPLPCASHDHTGLPWREGKSFGGIVSDDPISHGRCTGYDDSRAAYGGYLIAESMGKPDRDFVIKACNNHDAILAALDQCRIVLEDSAAGYNKGGFTFMDRRRVALERANLAIELVKSASLGIDGKETR